MVPEWNGDGHPITRFLLFFFYNISFLVERTWTSAHIFDYILLYSSCSGGGGPSARASEWLISRLGDGWLCSDLSSPANMVRNGKIDMLIRKVSSFA
jgi:hypothetical protein